MTDFALKVTGKRIIAKEFPEEKKEGVLIIPKAKPSEIRLQVLSVGDEMNILPGQTILVKAGWMYKFNFNEQELVLVPFEEIIGVVNEAK